MSEGIIKIKLASMFVDMFYDKIRYLSCNNIKDSVEYQELLKKIKHCVKIENEEYHLITDDDILTCLANIENDTLNGPELPRVYNKLMYEMHIRDGSRVKNNILLTDAITTKIIIDILKKLEERVSKFTSDDEEIDPAIINIYHQVYKFNYFTANNYIESLAIKYNFEISKMPNLYFTDIEANYNLNFTDDVKHVFLNYAAHSIDNLFSLNDDDEYALIYSFLFETTKIECLLNYLDYKQVVELQRYIDHNYKDNERKDIVKTLIKKRKEELH